MQRVVWWGRVQVLVKAIKYNPERSSFSNRLKHLKAYEMPRHCTVVYNTMILQHWKVYSAAMISSKHYKYGVQITSNLPGMRACVCVSDWPTQCLFQMMSQRERERETECFGFFVPIDCIKDGHRVSTSSRCRKNEAKYFQIQALPSCAVLEPQSAQ